MNNSDIVLLESAKLNQDPDAGGRMTGNIVPNGQLNALFPKISSVDRVAGRVHLLKNFAAVLTADQQSLQGAGVMLAVPPADDNTAVTLFSTRSDSDTRNAARDFLQSYLAAGPTLAIRLFDTQLAGQRSLRCWSLPDAPLPNVGDAVAVSDEPGGNVQSAEFVRITGLDEQLRTFYDAQNNPFQARVVTLSISQPLKRAYNGTLPVKANIVPNVVVRETDVADASRYYGARRLATAASAGDSAVFLDSIFGPLVPSAESENALTAVRAVGDVLTPVPATAAPISVNISSNKLGQAVHLGQAIMPGSLRITRNGMSGSLTDKDGQLSNPSAAGYNGSVNYQAGTFTVNATSGSSNTSAVATFIPAVFLPLASETALTEITEGNRGYSYVQPLNPAPQPGTTSLSYRALGSWYTLRDNGRGQLVGADPSYGTGTVDFSGRVASVALGREPDIGTALIWRWGASAEYITGAQDVGGVPVNVVNFDLSDDAPKGLERQSITLTYTDPGNTERTVTDNGSGALTGDGQGVVNYNAATIKLVPANGIKENTTVTVAATQYTTDKTSAVVAAGFATGAALSLGETNVVPGTVALHRNAKGEPLAPQFYITDDGNGALFDRRPSQQYGSAFYNSSQVGTIDYAAGTVTLSPQTTVSYSTTIDNSVSPPRRSTIRNETEADWVNTESLSVSFREGSNPVNAVNATVEPAPLEFTLAPSLVANLEPGGLRFSIGGDEYIDRAGVIYRNINRDTGAGTEAGSVNYASRTVTLTSYPLPATGAAQFINVAATVLSVATQVSAGFYGRTAGAPLKSGQFFVRATTAAGVQITANADAEGILSGTGDNGEVLSGFINNETGVYEIEASTAGGDALPIIPASVDYSAVVITFLPLDPELLGLDPVRLPQDGRVPLYRPGDIVVIHHTESETLPANIAPGDSYTFQRDKLALIELFDADDTRVALDDYSTDLAAGTVTLDAAADLSGYNMPLRGTGRREDQAMVSEIRLDGRLSLISSLQFDYPPEETIVSGLLRFGDLQATTTNLFMQETWLDTWADARAGSVPEAQYNATDNPVEVRNDGAVNERWALIFDSQTTYKIVAEGRGIVGSGSTAGDATPINPATGAPYFTLRSAGWGAGGFGTGNVLRFNTRSANAPIWTARTILAGAGTETEDDFVIEIRGNAD